ncbi:MAG: type IV toxin-antitoxin system AbiEi family antitoxin domain-containing protein [Frankiaceae bacterium]|nr:type IV toxin-antitoxin system AbiEi family antitoxin domain-containing protein [Frankiaceae bacterium]
MKPELELLAHRQGRVFRRCQAIAAGYTEAEIDRLLRKGTWHKVRHGIYTAWPFDNKQVTSDRYMHVLASAARVLAIGGDTLTSHDSAAVWHEIELMGAWPAEPTLTLARGDRAVTSRGYLVAPVPQAHRVAGESVTSAARTVVDCCRSRSFAAGLVTAESALRAGLDPAAIAAVLDVCKRWPGMATAREVIAFADKWSETALESLARIWCRDNGLPAPQQQRSVRTLGGVFVAEVDFVWDEFRTVLETDGRKKYAGETAIKKGGVGWKEKLREDTVRDTGLQVVRGYWSDGDDGGADLAARLRRAFERGLRETGEREYVLGPPVRVHPRPLAPRVARPARSARSQSSRAQ